MTWAARLILIAGVALACVTRGAAFNVDLIPRIEPGYTTQEEIREWFGEPQSVRVDSRGVTRWRYLHEEHTSRDTGTLTKIGRSIASIFRLRVFFPPVDVAYENSTRHELNVLLNPEGIVEDYVYERDDIPTHRVY